MRPELLDEVGFEHERVILAVGDDEAQVLRALHQPAHHRGAAVGLRNVLAHAVLQVNRLADVKRAAGFVLEFVDARRVRHGAQYGLPALPHTAILPEVLARALSAVFL